jgi:hypothetical protein
VYWGYSVPTGGVSVNGNTYYSSPRPVATTDNAAIDAWTSLSVEQQAEIEKIAKLQHYGREGSTLWGEAITAVSNLRAQGINMTPWQWLSQYAAQWQDQPATSTTSGGGGYGSGGGSSSSVALTNRFDARALVDSALNAYLGRDATPKERERFWKQLNSQEMANPRTAEMQGNVAVGSGGFNSQVFAEDYAKSLDDYAETQAGAVLMDYFKGLVKNAGSERIV